MERRIDTLCSFCRGHAEIGPHESYLPLCRDCRERLFGAPRDGSPDGLRKELTRLRKASKFSLLLTAFLLYDNRQLQRQLPQARIVSVDYDASTGEGTVESRVRMLLDEEL